jgi:endonuclease/exonuclease/phosphatase family metal-dependent hydrolase
MILITWNIHWCRGIDGRVDPRRIAQTALALADFDVLCVQELAIGFTSLPGSSGEDQLAALSAALPGYDAIFGAAVDLDAAPHGRRRFGNAIFTRLPVTQVFRHLLPWPADTSVPNMQRAALEAIVQIGDEPLRIVTTHLEYFSARQRMAQTEALLHLHAEACSHAGDLRPVTQPGEAFDAVARPRSALLCGDFNFRPHSPEHAHLTSAPAPGIPRLVDAWSICDTGPHAATVGVHEDLGGSFCSDFIFVTDDLAAGVRDLRVDAATQASVHQPVVVELAI